MGSLAVADGDIDSYSAFREADGKTSTGLAAFLRDLGIEALL